MSESHANDKNQFSHVDELVWSEEQLNFCHKVVSGIEFPVVDKKGIIFDDKGCWE
jgi:hypothetical protein